MPDIFAFVQDLFRLKLTKDVDHSLATMVMLDTFSTDIVYINDNPTINKNVDNQFRRHKIQRYEWVGKHKHINTEVQYFTN